MVELVDTQVPIRFAMPPPPALAGLVRYFHIECLSQGPVVVPATPWPAVTFFIRGGTRFNDSKGQERKHEGPSVSGPLTGHISAIWEPGTTFVSAVIEVGQFAHLFDVAPGELRDAMLPLADVAPDWAGSDALERKLRTSHACEEWVALMSEWLLQRARSKERSFQPFLLPLAFLELPTPEIAARFGISVRQLERRVMASYGQSIRDARRMMRYIRALSIMVAVPLRHGALTRLAVDCGYHDQAHMVHDFVQYTGLAPKALMEAAADSGGSLRLLKYDHASQAIVTREVY